MYDRATRFFAATLAEPAQVLRFGLGAAAASSRPAQPDASGNRLIDQRVERRGAERLEHRVAFDRVGTDVSGLKACR